MERGKLIPDQLFALDYGGSFRAFMLEVDRGTEPLQSSAARKSLKRSIEDNADVIEARRHKSHYGLNANLVVLWVLSGRTRQDRFLDLLGTCSNRVRQSMAVKVVDPRQIARGIDHTLFEGAWTRAGHLNLSLQD